MILQSLRYMAMEWGITAFQLPPGLDCVGPLALAESGSGGM